MKNKAGFLIFLAFFTWVSMGMIYASDLTSGVSANKPDGAVKAPVFSKFVYQGNDQVYNDYPLNPGEFYNPILQGCYPDPSITRKGDDYYVVCSSFAMFPGVPIFHSRDLVNWTQIGHVLDRKSQLIVHDCGISAGIYAPQIIYNPYNDTFYMITTQFAGNIGNMVVKTKDPMKGWSDPIKLAFDGIDPSLFFDEDGKGYVVHNDAPDRGKELYNGHRVIKIWDYDVANDRVVPGTDKIIVDGGVDLREKPIWIEAPHIYKKNGRYYLMCAEGGTGGWHSEVIFVSDHPKGPYTPAPGNPILTQRYFPRERANKVDWAGHADLVLGPDNQKYYAVFLAVRPNEKQRVNTGRETFILPVDWSGEWPVFENGLIPMKPLLKMPAGVTENKTGKEGFFPNGNFTFSDDFTSGKLDYRWIGLRGPREDFITVTREGLQVNPFTTHIKEVKPTSTLFMRQMHRTFSFAVDMNYKPASEKDLAGIVALQSESFNYVFGVTRWEGKDYLVLQRNQRQPRRRNTESKIMASTEIDLAKPLRLQVSAEGDAYTFSYSHDGTHFQSVGGTLSGDILSTDVAGGFTGCLLGLYATTANDAHPKAQNPIVFADVPDMSMLRVGDTYYMSSTTMHMNPGVPIMKSKDLANWEIVNYAYDILDDVDALNLANGKSTYGKGTWASCLRYHNGFYYLSTFAQTTGKTYIYKTRDIEKGPWEAISFKPSLHDHTLWFDDDGKVYVVWGNGKLSLAELKEDLSGIKEGTERVLIENASAPAGHNIGLGAEGSQLFKHDGKYYLFNITWPRGGMRTVVVHRADHITGPWEGKVAFQDLGVAQGGMVDTPDGRWFAYLFRDSGSVGRIPYLVPITWEEGWPVIGVDGKVPESLELPVSRGLIPGVVSSDEFNRKKGEPALPLVWQWNHNPDPSLWSVTRRKGFLRLTTGRVDTSFVMARNTLTQRTFGPVSSAAIRLDLSGMKEGDFAGLALLQRKFGQIGVKLENGRKSVLMVSNETDRPTELASVPLNQNYIFLKAACDFRDRADLGYFYYSLDGSNWSPLGREIKMQYTLMEHFMGYRFALFNYATRQPGGNADFDWFRISPQL